jgi:uncharacterized membrane protein
MNRPLVKRYPTVTYTAYTTIAGAIPLLLISAPAAVAQNWHAVSLGSWLLVGYMIVLPVYIAYMVWNWGISRRGAATASSYALLQPVLTGLLSSLLLGEVFDVPKIIGALLILFGLVALQQPAWLRRLPALQGSVKPSRSRNALAARASRAPFGRTTDRLRRRSSPGTSTMPTWPRSARRAARRSRSTQTA